MQPSLFNNVRAAYESFLTVSGCIFSKGSSELSEVCKGAAFRISCKLGPVWSRGLSETGGLELEPEIASAHPKAEDQVTNICDDGSVQGLRKQPVGQAGSPAYLLKEAFLRSLVA